MLKSESNHVFHRLYKIKDVKRGSSVVSALASGARGPRIDPRMWQGKFGARTRFLLCLLEG